MRLALLAVTGHSLRMPATKKINRVGSNILVALGVAFSLFVAASLQADERYLTPDKKLYDHGRIKNLNAEDAKYIQGRIEWYNANLLSKKTHLRYEGAYCTWLFVDNLQKIDEETAVVIGGNDEGRYWVR